MANREMNRRKAATILALIRETDGESIAEAQEEIKAMNYSDEQAAVIASALRKEWLPFTIKQALAEADLDDEEIESLNIPELKKDDNEEEAGEEVEEEVDEEVDEEVEEEEIEEEETEEEEVEEEAEEELNSIEEVEYEDGDIPISLQEDNVKFVEDEEDDNKVEDEDFFSDLEEGKEYTFKIGDDVLTLRLDEVPESEYGENEAKYEAGPNFARPKDSMYGTNAPRNKKEVGLTMSNKNRKKVLAESKLNDRNLDGEERSRPGAKTMNMDGPFNVSAPGEKGKRMNLTGSESNSLAEQNDLDFLTFEVPTSALDDRFLNHALKAKMNLEGAGGTLVEQFNNLELTDSSVPELPGNTGMFGEDKTMEEFDLPTQIDYATQRKITVARRKAQRDALLRKLAEYPPDEDNSNEDPNLDLNLDLDLWDKYVDNENNEYEFPKNPYKDEDNDIPENNTQDPKNPDDPDDPDLVLDGPDGPNDPDDPDATLGVDLKRKDEFTAAYQNHMKKLADKKYASHKLYGENLNSDTVMHKIANRECDGCNNPKNSEVEAVQCQDCGSIVVLCGRDINTGYCPGCADMQKTAQILAKKEIYASNKDYGDELCVHPSGTTWGGKDNGDGNFRTNDKKSGVEDDSVKEVERLKKALADEKVKGARLAAASRAAARMAERGLIEEDEIEDQIDMFTESGMSVNAINSFEKQAIRLAMKQDKNRAKNASVKTASRDTGIAMNYSMPTRQNDSPVDMKKQLRDIFMAKYDEYEREKM